MKNPPGLKGTIFSDKEKEIARYQNKLLFISLMTNPVCNLSCPDSLDEIIINPLRKKLLVNPKYNCLCRVYQRTSVYKKVISPEDLDKSKDYEI